jgi:hypothetical protein
VIVAILGTALAVSIRHAESTNESPPQERDQLQLPTAA